MLAACGNTANVPSRDAQESEEGRDLLNNTTHDTVVAALQARYHHLDTAHGYYNEYGVGQGTLTAAYPVKRYG